MVHVGDRYMLDIDRHITNDETRYGCIVAKGAKVMHAGQYVVDYVTASWVRLADASWDKKGNITFRSNKHGHILAKADLKKLYKVTKDHLEV